MHDVVRSCRRTLLSLFYVSGLSKSIPDFIVRGCMIILRTGADRRACLLFLPPLLMLGCHLSGHFVLRDHEGGFGCFSCYGEGGQATEWARPYLDPLRHSSGYGAPFSVVVSTAPVYVHIDPLRVGSQESGDNRCLLGRGGKSCFL